jgi:hypothetical protein
MLWIRCHHDFIHFEARLGQIVLQLPQQVTRGQFDWRRRLHSKQFGGVIFPLAATFTRVFSTDLTLRWTRAPFYRARNVERS